jgi:hypothetical protein
VNGWKRCAGEDHDDDDGVRLCLRTAANKWSYYSSPQVIYEHIEAGGIISTGEKLLICPPECSLAVLPAQPSSIKSGATWQRR